MILSVDLAARFSAGIVMSRDFEVHFQFDTWGRSQRETSLLIADSARLFDVEYVVIEDVPYGISKQFMTKPVTRLHGRIQNDLEDAGFKDRSYFLAPATWQRTFDGVWKGGTSGAAAAAASFGYTPPNMLEIHAHEIPERGTERTKIRTLLRKSMTDYVDAYLISRWANKNLIDGPFEIQGLQAA